MALRRLTSVRRTLVLLVVGYAISGGVAQAATYYVAKGGNNGNSCALARSVSSAKLTITAGISCLSAGDTLYVLAGSYDEGLDRMPSGTSWANPIRIVSYPGDTVWMRPLAHLVGNPGRVVSLHNGESYIEFDGINMDGRNIAYGVFDLFNDGANPDPHHIRLKNAEIIARSTDNSAYSDWASGAIGLGGETGGFELQNLTIHGGGRPGCSYDNHCNGYGIYLGTRSSLIENCDIYDTSAAGIHAYHVNSSSDGSIIRNNRVHDITRTGNGSQVWGILVVGSGNRVYNNLIYNINAGDVNSGNAGIAVSRSDNEIYNNTIVNNRSGGIALDENASNTEVRNNIVYGSGGSDFVNRGANTGESNNLFGVDPQFVGASANNFQLRPSSPAIDAGTRLSLVISDFSAITRPQGSAYDIGAYEFGAQRAAEPRAPANLRVLQ